MTQMEYNDPNNVSSAQFAEEELEVDNSGLKLETILDDAINAGASDVILTLNSPPILLLNSETKGIAKYGRLSAATIKSLIYSMLPAGSTETLENDLQADFSFESVNGRWRANVFYQRRTLGAVYRHVPTSIRTMDELGLKQNLKDVLREPRGLILVTGPTGSGKSTTLASMINEINREQSKHIITIEDPIEFMHDNIKSVIEQREIGADTRSFKDALRAVLRQAPHIILVGELRDAETIEAALTAAETGHLVMGTLHTNSASGTVSRIVDAFPAGKRDEVRSQLSSNLICVMSQTLVKRQNGVGRVMVPEILLRSDAVAATIRDPDSSPSKYLDIMRSEPNMVAMNDSLINLATSREISMEAAREASNSKTDFDSIVNLRGGRR